MSARILDGGRPVSKPRIKKIKKPGVYELSVSDYRSDALTPAPSLSSSIARILVSESPAHARWNHPRLNPQYEPEENSAFDIGTAIHDAVLEGIDRVELVRADNWRTAAARDQRDTARLKGRIPLLEKDYEHVAMAVQFVTAALADCTELGGVNLADGTAEASVYWQDVGCWARCRPDWMRHDARLMLDLKSHKGSVSPSAFSRHIINMGYHLQAAFYRRGVRAVKGTDPLFVFAAVEITPPYAVSFHSLAPSLMALADEQVEYAIRTWAECLRKNGWPAYSNRIHYAEAASYTMTQWYERQEGGEGVELYDRLFGRRNGVPV